MRGNLVFCGGVASSSAEDGDSAQELGGVGSEIVTGAGRKRFFVTLFLSVTLKF